MTAVYSRLREVNAMAALWGWALAIVGAVGSAVHGGYDLANAINPVAGSAALTNLPNPVDPRGLLAFGVTGMGQELPGGAHLSISVNYLKYS